MFYTAEELEVLLDKIGDKMREIITTANREDNLRETLQRFGMEELITGVPKEPEFEHSKTGKILIAGDCQTAGIDKLIGVARKLGISKDRLEFLNFHEVKMEDFRGVQYQSRYAAIMIGPTGHSGRAKGNHSSVKASLEQEPGYPPVIELLANSTSREEKITNTNFRKALEALRDNGIIQIA